MFVCTTAANRGAGCFLGDAQLKALIQWAAASEAGLSMCYFPWEDDYIAAQLQPVTYALTCCSSFFGCTSSLYWCLDDSLPTFGSSLVMHTGSLCGPAHLHTSEEATARGTTVGQLCEWLFTLTSRNRRCSRPGFDTLEAFSKWVAASA